jgi:hypothetical protein
VYYLLDFTEDVCVKAAEIGDAGSSSHSTEKAIAFNQKHASSISGCACGSGQACGAAAQNYNIVFAKNRDIAGRFSHFCVRRVKCHDGFL